MKFAPEYFFSGALNQFFDFFRQRKSGAGRCAAVFCNFFMQESFHVSEAGFCLFPCLFFFFDCKF